MGFSSRSPQCVPGGSPKGFHPFLPHPNLLPLQNHSNSDVVSIDCNVKLAPNEELSLHLRGNLWMKSLKAVSPPIAFPPREPSCVWGDLCPQRPLILWACASNTPHSTSLCGV